MTSSGGRIVGIGVDLLEIDRVKLAHLKHGDIFLQKLFNDDEIADCFRKTNPYPSLAARFAAKEAAYKALSQAGIRIVRWHDYHVRQSDGGVPAISVAGVEGIVLHLSLSHTGTLAMATVVAEALSA